MAASARNTMLILLAAACFAGLALAPAATALAQTEPAAVAPDDTVLFVCVPDASALVAKFKETAWYGLYKEPAMQPCIGPAQKKITEAMEKGLADTWGKLGVDKPAEIPWPTGRITLVMRLAVVTRQVRDITQNVIGNDHAAMMRDVKSLEPQVVMLADMGEHLDAARTLTKKILDASVEKGDIRRQQETIRGVDFDAITPIVKKAPDADAKEKAAPAKPQNPGYLGFKDNTAIFGTDLALLKDVLARLTGPAGDLATLASDPGYQAVRKALGDSTQAMCYVNIRAILKATKETQDANDREQTLKMMTVFGVDNIDGAGLGVELAPNKSLDARVRVQLAVRGEKKGLVALLTPPSKPLRTDSLASAKGLAGVMVANYDIGKLINGILALVKEQTGTDVMAMMEAGLAMADRGGDDNKPQLNLKKDIIDRLAGPLSLVVQMTKPYTADSQQVVFSLGLNDAKAFEQTFARLHEMLTGGDKKQRRDLLNTKIYLLPGAGAALAGLGGEGNGEAAGGVAFVANNLVAGPIKSIEQAIRDSAKAGGGEDLSAEPEIKMFRHAVAMLPAQAGLWGYVNVQMSMAQTWGELKNAAKNGPARPAGNGPPAIVPPTFNFQAKGIDELGPPKPAANPADAVTNPSALASQLGQLVDLSLLPDYGVVKKYFGAMAIHLSGNDQGVLAELLLIKPPAAE